jgi:hypothetical protein
MWPHRGFPTDLCNTADVEHCVRFYRCTLRLSGSGGTQERAVALDKAAPHDPDVTLEDHHDGSQGNEVHSKRLVVF